MNHSHDIKNTISIIVPVYNTEQYLYRCIDSILAQTFTDFELLLIDDGSKDSSGKICDEYAQKDSRVKVFHKENGGVSAARNVGLDNAQGEWITFVDSDDWVDKDYLYSRLHLALTNNADFVYCDLWDIQKDKHIYHKSAECYNKKEDMINEWISTRATYSVIILARKNLYKNNNIRFREDIRFCEDFILTIKLLHYAERIVHCREALYYYDKTNENSTMHNLSRHRKNLEIVYCDLITFFKRNNCFENYKEAIYWLVVEYKAVSIISDKIPYHSVKDFYPESHSYILSNSFLSWGARLILYAYTHKLSLISHIALLFYRITK